MNAIKWKLVLILVFLVFDCGPVFAQVPTITSMSPTTGPVGAPIQIIGTNFGTSGTVTLNGVSAVAETWSATSITAIVPTGATTGTFAVTVGGQVAHSTTFTVAALQWSWSHADVGSVGTTGSASFASGTFTISSSGQIIGGTADGMQFVYQTLAGDGTIVARVKGIQGSAASAAAGVMVRETLNSGATSAFVGYSNAYAADYFPVRPSTGADTTDQGDTYIALPVWVKLVRAGNSFNAYSSATGYAWQQMGTTQTVAMAQTVYVGLAVASGNTSNVATATFDNVSVASLAAPAPTIATLSATTGPAGTQVTISGSNFGSQTGMVTLGVGGALVVLGSWTNTSITVTIPSGALSGIIVVAKAVSLCVSNPVYFEVTSQPLPAPWKNQDVGIVGPVGSATFANRVFTLSSSGPQVGGTADGLHFAYQTLSGDGTIIARVAGIQGVSTSAAAGVMIRETLDASATSAFVGYSNSYALSEFPVRPTTGADTTDQGDSYISMPVWVMLVRTGNAISGFSSANGYEWKQMGTTQTVTVAQNVYVGLALASGSAANVATATFDNVSITSVGGPAPNIDSLSSTTVTIGSQVIIAGTNFGTQTGMVTLNGTATTINSWTNTAIVITIPAGATSGLLAVCVTPSSNFSNQLYFEVTTQPLPSSWKNEDLGVGGQPSNVTYAAGTITVTSAGQQIGGTADGMQYVYQPLSGNGTIVARVVSTQGSSSAIAGVMIRETLLPTSTNASAAYWAGFPTVFFDARPSTGADTISEGSVINNPTTPYWVKLIRSGNTISAYACADGLNWAQVGTSQTITMASNVFIGLAVASGNTASTVTATFDNVSVSSSVAPAPIITNVSRTTGAVGTQVVASGLGFGVSQGSSSVLLNGVPVTINSWTNTSITLTIPTGATSGVLAVVVAPTMDQSNPIGFTVTSQALPVPWLDQDVSNAGMLGTATYSGSTFTVNGSGQGLGSYTDGLHFAYQQLAGDGTIIARIASVQGASSIGAAMIRETLDSAATNVSAGYWQGYPAVLFYDRATTGSLANSQAQVSGSPTLPYWVKIVRSGNIFSVYGSQNGSTWTQMGTSQTIAMASNVYAGLVSTSSTTSTLAVATFDNVSLTAGLRPFVSGLTPNSGKVGDSITVAGTSFGATQGTSSITFNGTAPASITSWTNTQIVAKVASNVTTGPVVVTVNSIPSNSNVDFTAFNPIITSLTPPAGEQNGQVVIAGSGFGPYQNGGIVKFNGVAAIVASWSDTVVAAFVPNNATTGSVTITMNGVTSNTLPFTVTSPLSITGLSSNSGQIGQSITVTGTGFGGTQSNSILAFNGTPATITSWTNTSAVGTVPSGATTGPVTIQVANVTAPGPVFIISNSVTLTDSLGHQTTYSSQMVGGKWYVNSSQGSGCSSCTLRGTISNQYDSFGNVTQRTDALGYVTLYTYDFNQNLASVSAQSGPGTYATTTYTYNNFGEPLTVTDPLGNTTTNTYDTKGNLLSVNSPPPDGNTASSVTQFAYNSLGELTQITDPLGHATTLSYSTAGLISTITDAQNNVTTYGYDAHGNRISVKDALSHQTTFGYDAGDRLKTITYPDNTTSTFAYDVRGRRTSVTDQNSKTTIYNYDDADRLTSVKDAANNTTTYGYDTENNLTSILDANGHSTTFSYDAFGRVTQTNFPSTLSETYAYDANNNLTSKTDRKGQTITFVYDALNRMTKKQYPNSTEVDYIYDLVNKIQQVNDPTGTYAFAYDNMGRLIGTTTSYSFLAGRNFTTAYTYDKASNRTGFTDPEAGSTTYAYDTLNRLATLTPPSAFSATGSFGLGYDALSRRTSMTRPNSVTTTYAYDNFSRLSSVLHKLGASTIDGASYTVDNAGNRTAKTDQRTAVTTSYGYDSIYQLLSATQGATTTESYTYDPVGNRTASLGISSYTTNSSNELTSKSGGVSYTYDNNGNTLTNVTGSNTTTYAWDFENRLTSVTLPGGGGTITFKYDPFGRRIYKSSSSGTSIYAHDGSNLVEETNSGGTAVVRYSQGLYLDDPLAMLRSSNTSYYQTDGLGSVTSLSNAAGALANTYVYESFGRITASTGSLVNPFRFTAREFDSETNLQFSRYRYYDPSAGRFLSEDPTEFMGGINFYRYVLNDPVNLFDPFGLRDYSQNETNDLFLTPAYSDATAGFFKGLWNIHSHSQGGADYDFAHNKHAGDTFVICGVTMSAGDFGNYIAGFQAGAWDEFYYGNGWRKYVRYAEGAAYVAGVYYHATGQSDVPNDPWDKTGRPWITLGVQNGRNFGKSQGSCSCE